MLQEEDITYITEFQGFSFEKKVTNPVTHQIDFYYKSKQKSTAVVCPHCGGKAHIRDYSVTTLKDMPFIPFVKHRLKIIHHRYICTVCGRSFTEKLSMQHPKARITKRAAVWIRVLLSFGIPIFALSKLMGIHWNTIRRIHADYMNGCLKERENEWKRTGYKPKYLAVDEFAIHKGHTYATCVMDLETGEVIWAGKGRTIEDFRHFFKDMDKEFLSEVKAVAMDMNAAYNRVVTEHLPKAEIVYDRYHFQADFGKNVLGCIRLDEAREHKAKAECLKDKLQRVEKHTERVKLKRQIREEQSLGSAVKRARWLILAGSDKLKSQGQITLQNILDTHTDIALCYAMKEELCRLFALNDRQEAEHGWKSWFEAGKASEVEHLNRFAKTKEFRLQGLIAHAEHPISTGKLEGVNNKIKVAKRIAYGYRNDSYFFTLVRFISLPSHAKT